jgi:type IV secretion system protein VirD4
MSILSLKKWGLDSRTYTVKDKLVALGIGLTYFLLGFVTFSYTSLIKLDELGDHQPVLNQVSSWFLPALYLILVVYGIYLIQVYVKKHDKGNIYIVSLLIAIFSTTILNVLLSVLTYLYFSMLSSGDVAILMDQYLFSKIPVFIIALCLIGIAFFGRLKFRSYRMSVKRGVEDTSKNLGSAQMATEEDITRYGLRIKEGVLLGKDHLGYLRSSEPRDRLILAYRGGGKTSAILIPEIIDKMAVNKFIVDIKGELASVTAAKAKASGRDIYIIDPFKVLKSLGVEIETHHINPLAYIDDNNMEEKDRFVSSLAAALSSSDQLARSETEKHFSENAQIILEGLLDHYITKFKKNPDQMNLVALHDWWLDVVNDPESQLITEMKIGSHKERAAASQLTSAGNDESGSMKTTIYRQFQWLRSESIRRTFSKDDIDLDQFAKGNCDIYVVLPEDMMTSFSRLIRVVMALIKVKLLQLPVRELKSQYRFILDELGQLGYCPDVEQIINSMRSRRVFFDAAFQTIDQIEVYKDSTVFKGMPIKQFLRCTDTKTAQWIQTLAGPTTVLVENISKNTNSSGKGSSSTSESVSISEHSTNLIHSNEIRELPDDEQYIFIDGRRPIRCKKAYYFKEKAYENKYDDNPLETK